MQNLEKAKNVSRFCSIRPKNHVKTACFYAFLSIWQTNKRCEKLYLDLILKGILQENDHQLAENGGNEGVSETQKIVFRSQIHSICNGRELSWRAQSCPFRDVEHCSGCPKA